MFVTAKGCKVHVRVSGDESSSKPPVLLLHGFPDTGALWDRQVPALTAAGYKVITPDLPGFGQSDKPEELSFYKTENIIGIVIAFLEELKAEKIEKLAVLSVGFPGVIFAVDPGQRPRSWYSLFFRFPDAEKVLMANDWALWKQLMAGQTTDEQQNEYITRMSEPGALTAGLNWYRANMTAEHFGATQPAPPPGGKPLGMPVLGLWSTGDDHYLTEAGMIQSAALVAPGKWRYERVEASSHWMMVVEPEKINKLLLEFITQSPDPHL